MIYNYQFDYNCSINNKYPLYKDKKILNNILVNFLKENEGSFIKASQLEKLSQQYGYLAETGRRRLRELTQPKHRSFNPHIEKKEFDGVIYYRYVN